MAWSSTFSKSCIHRNHYMMMSDWDLANFAHAYYFAGDCEWPLRAINVEGEEEDYQEDGFRDIDVLAELRRKTSLALSVVEDAIGLSGVLRRPLGHIVEMFIRMPGWQHSDGDDLEQHAATSLMQVDELLRQQTAHEAPPLPPAAVEELKLLQRCAQDLAVLATCRFIDQRMMQDKGIPRSIVIRLEASFGPAALQNDNLWSRIGNSKYHLFTRGLSGPLAFSESRILPFGLGPGTPRNPSPAGFQPSGPGETSVLPRRGRRLQSQVGGPGGGPGLAPSKSQIIGFSVPPLQWTVER